MVVVVVVVLVVGVVGMVEGGLLPPTRPSPPLPPSPPPPPIDWHPLPLLGVLVITPLVWQQLGQVRQEALMGVWGAVARRTRGINPPPSSSFSHSLRRGP